MTGSRTTSLWWGWWIGLACLVAGGVGFSWWDAVKLERAARAMDSMAIPTWGHPSFWRMGVVDVEVAVDLDTGEVIGRATCESSCDCFVGASEMSWEEMETRLPRDFGPRGWWSGVLRSGQVSVDRKPTRSVFKVSGGGGYVVVADCARGDFVFWGRVN